MAMGSTVFIPDGFTFSGKVDGVPGLLRPLTFKYRPAGYQARSTINAAYGDPGKHAEAVFKVLAAQTAEWKAENDDGTDGPAGIFKPGDFARLPSVAIETALAYVMGQLGPVVEEEAGKSPAGSA